MKALAATAAIVSAGALSGAAMAEHYGYNSYYSTYSFGSDGTDGWDGSTGTSGRDGNDVAVTADGTFTFLDLRGTDGRDGQDGSDGHDASGCWFSYYPAHNLRGADGGDGGDAGDGGRGGDGGSVTVFYDDLSALKQIRVLSTPGRGAQPGRPGRGGEGCRCPTYSWTKESCHTDSDGDTHCSTQTYYCSSGSDGRYGSSGSSGREGYYGGIYLVKDLETLPEERLSAGIRLGDLAAQEVELKRNRWTQHAGAEALFAPGSDIRSDYLHFRENIARRYTLKWAAPRPMEQFAGRAISLAMGADFRIRASLPSDLWAITEEAVDGDLTTLVIKNVVTGGEAVSLQLGELTGSGHGLELAVVDTAGVSDLVKTSFRVKLETKVLLWYKDRFEGDLPEDLVVREGNTFHLRLGELLKKEKWAKPGKDIRVAVTATRTFAGKADTWSVEKVKLEVPKIKK